MSNPDQDKLRHILLVGTAHTESYAPPRTGGGDKPRLPARDRQTHGGKLLRELEQIRERALRLSAERAAFGIDAGDSIYIQFESEPGLDLELEGLDSARAGIELLAVKKHGDKVLATCLVPDGKLPHFFKIISEYLDKDTRFGKPKRQSFVDRVSEIRAAMLEALWTDDNAAFPVDDEVIFWEVWLRVGRNRESVLSFFKNHAAQIGLEIGPEQIRFPDRTIVLARGAKSQMSQSVNLLNSIAEVRRAKETADFFSRMSALEQSEWMDDALTRLNWPNDDSPAICILDTGVNNEHPMLRGALDSEDMHSYDPDWGVADHHGHGTEMAGLSLYGDLTDILASTEPLALDHRLESVKILPPFGDNPPHLYGAITSEAVSRAEIEAPDRSRIFCMAISAADFRDRGKPSSWSARLDALASGADDGQQRLIVVCAGNTDYTNRHQYPESNHTDGIHDPGQAWNAVTVGAYTEKVSIQSDEYPGWKLVAPYGDLSPSSCTSLVWQRPWPAKPDIVMEGGNMAVDPSTGAADYLDSLCLLSMNRNFLEKLFAVTRDTSAATALASRMAATLQAGYPDFWPETIRALIVHSAQWTDVMRARIGPLSTKSKVENLLRCYGFGVPSFERAMWSANNSLTLIAQDSLQPFGKFDGKYKARDMNLHYIPWPREILEELGATDVRMKVTLSYFIEPNPGERGWTRRYSYASHGLRFDVKTPTESLDEFRRRINRIAFEEERGDKSSSDASRWLLGPDLRGLGSLHSDIWNGTAAELAQRGFIAVYPVIGWWRERHQLEKWWKRARYSLIVTIETSEADVDIYTPVLNLISLAVETEV